MNAVLSRLLSDPKLVESLIGRPLSGDLLGSIKKIVKDPQALTRLAGLSGFGSAKLKKRMEDTLSSLLAPQTGGQSSRAVPPRQPWPCPGGGAAKFAIPVTAVVSLAAVAGAVAVVGTVSAVALNSQRAKHAR